MAKLMETDAALSSEAFAGRMLEALNRSFLTLGVSIGHRTGLFDVMAALPPATSVQIAEAAGLHERYVREWLGLMVVGGIVHYDPATQTFRLPAAHAGVLTRSAGPDNLATMAQFLPLLASVEDRVVACFREGGGVPYAEFRCFQHIMAEDTAQVQDASLLQVTLPLFPELQSALRAGSNVLEIGCGHGHALNLMASAFPASRFRGIDLSDEAIAAARAEADALRLDNASFDVADAITLDAENRYGVIVALDVIHDLAHPANVLAAIQRALRPDGHFLMIDIAASSRLEENIDHPLGPFLYAASLMHCMTVSLAQGGVGLGTVWGEQRAREMLAAAGFDDVRVERVPHDILNLYYLAKPGKAVRCSIPSSSEPDRQVSAPATSSASAESSTSCSSATRSARAGSGAGIPSRSSRRTA
jgi:2-polyprenyl-3-methyl-5-hydroxy-6-metoxy-1,4-benzoquinol methylase